MASILLKEEYDGHIPNDLASHKNNTGTYPARRRPFEYAPIAPYSIVDDSCSCPYSIT